MIYRGLDKWIEGDPDAFAIEMEKEMPEKSAMETLGIPSLGYVLNQYRDDIRFASILTAGQKERRIEMIEAALKDFEPEWL